MKNGARARPSRKLHPASIAAARCCGRNTNCCECYAKKIGLVTPGGFEFVATAFTLNCLILPPLEYSSYAGIRNAILESRLIFGPPNRLLNLQGCGQQKTSNSDKANPNSEDLSPPYQAATARLPNKMPATKGNQKLPLPPFCGSA